MCFCNYLYNGLNKIDIFTLLEDIYSYELTARPLHNEITTHKLPLLH